MSGGTEMAISSSQKKDIDLTNELRDVSDNAKEEALNAAGSVIIDMMLDKMGDGSSPVMGERFPKLSKAYAKKEKHGDRTPNLNLDGDMWDAIESESSGNILTIGVNKSDELKADNHNGFGAFGSPTLPQRRFIPAKEQKFKRDIMAAVRDTIDLFSTDISKIVNEVKKTPLDLPSFGNIIDATKIPPKSKDRTLPKSYATVAGASEGQIESLIKELIGGS